MDLALAIDALVPAAEYGGSTTGNDRGGFDALDWKDRRPKPSWDEIVAADAKSSEPTPDDVSVERERRLSLGCTVTLSSGQGPIPVQTRDEVDHRNLLTLESQAIKAVISGAPNTPFAFRDAHDKTWTLTALEMMDMTAKVAAFGAGIFAKSWALKAMSPIPATYQSDEWWT